jgi:hypothetical protein
MPQKFSLFTLRVKIGDSVGKEVIKSREIGEENAKIELKSLVSFLGRQEIFVTILLVLCCVVSRSLLKDKAQEYLQLKLEIILF